MLVSKCKITDKDLSEFQLKQIVQKREADYLFKHKKQIIKKK